MYTSPDAVTLLGGAGADAADQALGDVAASAVIANKQGTSTGLFRRKNNRSNEAMNVVKVIISKYVGDIWQI